MTEDTSPENLRKFLESDDPAIRRMGLSMAKGVGVPVLACLWMHRHGDFPHPKPTPPPFLSESEFAEMWDFMQGRADNRILWSDFEAWQTATNHTGWWTWYTNRSGVAGAG